MRLPILLLCLCAAACATPVAAPGGVTFIVVRHAEKSGDDPRDPGLSRAGEQRASHLAESLATDRLVAAYATAYLRTQQTARPAAQAQGIAVTTYDAARPAVDFAAELRRSHDSGTVLVVGHSNTVPEIAAALCGCSVAPLGEDDFGDLYRIRIDAGGSPALRHERY